MITKNILTFIAIISLALLGTCILWMIPILIEEEGLCYLNYGCAIGLMGMGAILILSPIALSGLLER